MAAEIQCYSNLKELSTKLPNSAVSFAARNPPVRPVCLGIFGSKIRDLLPSPYYCQAAPDPRSRDNLGSPSNTVFVIAIVFTSAKLVCDHALPRSRRIALTKRRL